MKRKDFQFQAEFVKSINDGKILVEGRCCAGAISVGDRFTEIYSQHWSRNEEGFPTSNLMFDRNVDFEILSIQSARGSAVAEGETATIVLAGGEIFAPNMMLEGKTAPALVIAPSKSPDS